MDTIYNLVKRAISEAIDEFKPIAFVRPDDWMVFSLNADNCTYSLENSKTQFPDALHIEYTRDTLRNLGFHEIYRSQNEYKLPKERNCGDDE